MNPSAPSECDADCEMLVSPIPRPRVPAFDISRCAARRGVYFIDTWKPNSLAILKATKSLLEERDIPTVALWSKQDPSRPLTAAELERVVRESEGTLVLIGVADCGSCSSSSALDAIFLQQRGVVALPILTAPFAKVPRRVQSIWQADGDIPSIVLDHPIQALGSDEVERRAHHLLRSLERFLPSPEEGAIQ
jgi:hypothetical protein